MSMVFQHFALLPHRTVLDNVAYGLEIQGMPRAEREAKAREVTQVVGLGGWEDKHPSELSGGMQQRVGLARALAADTEVLLMDEAFSALDPLIRREMQEQLLELQSTLGKTIVFITHDLNEAMFLGDRIAVMRDGRIVQIGTPEEILTDPANDYVEQFVQDVDRTRVLTAESVMRKPRAIVHLTAGPHGALKTMRDEQISGVYVAKRDRTLIGWVSDRDCLDLVRKGEREPRKHRPVRPWRRVEATPPCQNCSSRRSSPLCRWAWWTTRAASWASSPASPCWQRSEANPTRPRRQAPTSTPFPPKWWTRHWSPPSNRVPSRSRRSSNGLPHSLWRLDHLRPRLDLGKPELVVRFPQDRLPGLVRRRKLGSQHAPRARRHHRGSDPRGRWPEAWKFGIGTAVGFLFIVGVDQWENAMDSLSLVVVSAFLAIIVSIPIGIWAARNDVVSAIVKPIMDFLQTMPALVYLIPAIALFRIGVAPGIFATVLFAMAPGVRLTELGIRGVDHEVVEAGHAFGASPGRILRQIQLPLAMPSIMAGINQIIMLSLSMIVIAGFVGAGGLGGEVTKALSALDKPLGFEAGTAVVVLAIILDRFTGAFGNKRAKSLMSRFVTLFPTFRDSPTESVTRQGHGADPRGALGKPPSTRAIATGTYRPRGNRTR